MSLATLRTAEIPPRARAEPVSSYASQPWATLPISIVAELASLPSQNQRNARLRSDSNATRDRSRKMTKKTVLLLKSAQPQRAQCEGHAPTVSTILQHGGIGCQTWTRLHTVWVAQQAMQTGSHE